MPTIEQFSARGYIDKGPQPGPARSARRILGTQGRRDGIKKKGNFFNDTAIQHAHRTTEGGLADNLVLAEIAGDQF